MFGAFFRMERDLPSPTDLTPRYRVHIEDHFWRRSVQTYRRWGAAIGRRSQLSPGWTPRDLPALQFPDSARASGVRAMRGIAFVWQFGEVLLAIALAPLFSGWIAQCRAWMQNRTAPPLTQPYRMLRKLFLKDVALAENASWLFRTAPYVSVWNHGSRRGDHPLGGHGPSLCPRRRCHCADRSLCHRQSVSGSRGDGHRNCVWNSGSSPGNDGWISLLSRRS